ncbi:glycoside hydrolase family 9 protein [Myxosarcina sp. GI1]|uniref:glycoside hydrolase family 9 protein n=1 Tax=Myxosarcina sp. GI1 TaxID=1541065 RepID=UPI0005679C7C|nr:glycoside hydrolase family 9 protein [Myxosarcina sp. GI1]
MKPIGKIARLKSTKKIGTIISFLLVFFISSLPLKSTTQFNYGEALQKSILFYEAQQAGELPDWNRVPWRGNAAIDDGADVGIDLSGGWFDAGDHVKFGFPMAASATTLAWGGIEYYDAYQNSGQLDALTKNIRWVTDYFLKAFANDTPENYVLYGQVGNAELDHNWWGAAEVVRYQMERPAYKIDTNCPGSDLASETSAALASASILFRKTGDIDYANLLVTKAERLYEFADRYRGAYSDCITAAVPYYKSYSGYQDELVWGAIWLHKAKQAQNYSYGGEYLSKAIAEYQAMSKPYNYTFITDDKSYGVYVLLAKETEDPEYQQRAEAWLDFWSTGYQGEKIQYTPGGLAFLTKWGSLALAANTSFVGFVYSDWLRERGEIAKADRYFNFGVSQINYILGNNPHNRSYLIGYGHNYPQNPHHRTAHGSWTNDSNNPAQSRNLLIGALVGGPDEHDNWQDNRNDWVANEVAIGYNAGFSGALAKMYAEFGGQPTANIVFEPPETEQIYVETDIKKARNQALVTASIINKSAFPARGLENAALRVFYTIDPKYAETVSVSSNNSECFNSSSSPVKVEQNLYYAEISCQGTVIYPGGESQYRKQAEIALNSNANNNDNYGLLDNITSIFARPLEVVNLELRDRQELIWSHKF